MQQWKCTQSSLVAFKQKGVPRYVPRGDVNFNVPLLLFRVGVQFEVIFVFPTPFNVGEWRGRMILLASAASILAPDLIPQL